MQAQVLVVSPDPELGRILCRNLEANGRYQVFLAQNYQDALEEARRCFFPLAVLDSSLGLPVLKDLVRELAEELPELQWLCINPENESTHPGLAGLHPAAVISRPLYFPGLIVILDKLTGTTASTVSIPHGHGIETDPPPAWLADSGSAAGVLAVLLQGISAKGAVVCSSGGLLVSTGTLPGDILDQAASLVKGSMDSFPSQDLARTISTSPAGRHYLLFATPLIGDLSLGLIFSPRTALDQTRSQTLQVANILKDPDLVSSLIPAQHAASVGLESSPGDIPEPTPAQVPYYHLESQTARHETSPVGLLDGAVAIDEPTPASLNKPAAAKAISPRNPKGTPSAEDHYSPAQPASPGMDVAGTSVQQIQPADGANLDLEIVKITQTGTKGRQSRSDEGLDMPAPSLEGSERPENLSINLPSEPPPLSHPPEETKAPAQSQESALAETLIQPGDEVQPVPVRPAPARTGPDGSILYFPWEEDPLQTKLHGSDPLNADPVKATEVEDTRPQHGHRARGLDLHPAPLFEEVPQLQYTFLLIPRLPQQELDPRLVNPLAHWFHELCLTFGWKLLSMDIQATYLECAVQVTPQVSPGNLVRILRNHTSQRIFAVFPNLAEDNPTGDFWAPGYLIVSGRQPPEPEAVAAFIRNTRRRQGY